MRFLASSLQVRCGVVLLEIIYAGQFLSGAIATALVGNVTIASVNPEAFGPSVFRFPNRALKLAAFFAKYVTHKSLLADLRISRPLLVIR